VRKRLGTTTEKELEENVAGQRPLQGNGNTTTLQI